MVCVMPAIALALALFLECHGAVQPAPAVAPPPAYSVGAAYDAARGRLVIFGGFAGGAYVGDTWEWDGRAWTRSTTTGPSARNSPALAYDEARRQIVMFGGDTRRSGALGDTWVYDGTWREIAAPGPPPRTTHQMVYDARRRRIVLFGGVSGDEMRGDTWEWDGVSWTRMATDGPSARALHGLAYDAARGRTVLFGGTARLAPDAPSFGDTWEWDGARWTRAAAATGPSARDHVAMGYDAARRVVVLHGGGLGPEDSGQTWTYDGRAWKLASAAGPPRRYAKLAFDRRAGALLLFGGFDREPSNELWRRADAGWSRIAP